MLFTVSTFKLLSNQQLSRVLGEETLSILLNPESALLLHPLSLCDTTQEGWSFQIPCLAASAGLGFDTLEVWGAAEMLVCSVTVAIFISKQNPLVF